MKKALWIICLCVCPFGMSTGALAEDGGNIKLLSLMERSPAQSTNYTRKQTFAQSSCSVSCGNANYSTTCSSGQQCACSCDSGCSCR